MELYVGLFLGISLLLIKRLNVETAKSGFTIGGFIKKNIFSIAGNVIAGVILIMSGYVAKYVTDTEMQFIVSASFGMTGMTMLQGLFDIFDKDKKTAIGINK